VDPWESWCPRQDLNWVSPKYKAEALPLDPTFQLQKKMENKIQVARLHGKRPLGQLGVRGRIVLKLVLKG